MLACQPVVLHSAASLGGDTAGQLRKLLWRRNAKKGRNNAQVLHVMKAVPCTAKTMFCYGCGQRFTCWERLCKHLAVGGHPHERGGNNAEKNNKGVVAPPRKRKTPQPAAPPVKDVAQEERFRRFWASEGEDVENQDELDAVLEWMKTTQGDKDPLASPAAAAFMRQGLLTGMLGIE